MELTAILAVLRNSWPLIKRLFPYVAGAAVLAFILWKVHAYGEEQYKAGYAAAQAIGDKKVADLKIQHQNEVIAQQKLNEETLNRLQKEYEVKLKEAQGDVSTATANASNANKKAEDYYAKWQEAMKHVPLSSNPNSNTPFTNGFVGLFNLATSGVQAGVGSNPPGTAGSAIDASAISQAADPGQRSAQLDLTATSSVTVDDVLNTVRANMKIANQCKADRAEMKTLLDKLCAKGYCN